MEEFLSDLESVTGPLISSDLYSTNDNVNHYFNVRDESNGSVANVDCVHVGVVNDIVQPPNDEYNQAKAALTSTDPEPMKIGQLNFTSPHSVNNNDYNYILQPTYFPQALPLTNVNIPISNVNNNNISLPPCSMELGNIINQYSPNIQHYLQQQQHQWSAHPANPPQMYPPTQSLQSITILKQYNCQLRITLEPIYPYQSNTYPTNDQVSFNAHQQWIASAATTATASTATPMTICQNASTAMHIYPQVSTATSSSPTDICPEITTVGTLTLYPQVSTASTSMTPVHMVTKVKKVFCWDFLWMNMSDASLILKDNVSKFKQIRDRSVESTMEINEFIFSINATAKFLALSDTKRNNYLDTLREAEIKRKEENKKIAPNSNDRQDKGASLWKMNRFYGPRLELWMLEIFIKDDHKTNNPIFIALWEALKVRELLKKVPKGQKKKQHNIWPKRGGIDKFMDSFSNQILFDVFKSLFDGGLDIDEVPLETNIILLLEHLGFKSMYGFYAYANYKMNQCQHREE
ncbi:hypothetical protein SAMD00019534_020940 [Acytostelium subglobosum LB1]|uniref:hypothetical protein n=1 Tax=Acytostelium subglobosum LB1 TaxID=1410327 RepID=UPI0006448E9E|nr:hypothetical protein SAMD00019534_020940 [Acytostelium subglobosum LB1]GAM18919.1 hypothetical protein SAMD00019534_020940 [Acytostelium subglobosum LB1]|eukprot:XP_012758139.1 hypothetical protein SAMD00019534_020940 [Acytostelium subglobosum LB1]